VEAADKRIIASRVWIAITACIALATSCASDKTRQQKDPSRAGERKSSQVEAPYEVGADNARTGVAALAGAWTGSTEVKGYGFATAILSLDSHGQGVWSGSLSGLPHSGTLRVTFWDGQWLHGEAMGHRQRVRAKLKGGTLLVDLPYVGKVLLYRVN
jgi:hypothetical protein